MAAVVDQPTMLERPDVLQADVQQADVQRSRRRFGVHPVAGVGVAFVALAALGSVVGVDQGTGGAATGRDATVSVVAGRKTPGRNGTRGATAKVPRASRVTIDAAVMARARAENEQKLREAQLYDAQVAQFYAVAAEYYRPKTGVNWDGIAQCETASHWSMQGPSFSGGLGFYNGTWSGFGGGQFAGNAGQATREQQIVVAERVYAEFGLSGWGCRAYG